MGVKFYIKDCWHELWNPDSKTWQHIDRILFILLPLIPLLSHIMPEQWKESMANLVWAVPLSIWVAFCFLIVPYRLATKYRKQGIETKERLESQVQEMKQRLQTLEEKSIPCIEVHPLPCKRRDYERDNKTAWAALQVTNTSSGVDLENVSVQILELMQVYERQDEQGKGTGIYSLHGSYPRWSPANVYWSETNAPAKQFEISIPRGATRLAVIAFHLESGPALAILNTPQYPHMLEYRMVIAISSRNMNTWQGAYYIEYVPPRQDKFEFVEWDLWCAKHNVIERSTPDNGDSQT